MRWINITAFFVLLFAVFAFVHAWHKRQEARGIASQSAPTKVENPNKSATPSGLDR